MYEHKQRADSFATFDRLREIITTAGTLLFVPAEEPPFTAGPVMVALSDSIELDCIEIKLA